MAEQITHNDLGFGSSPNSPNCYYVYAYYEPNCSYPFYIGKGKGDRAWEHLYPSYYLKYKDAFHKKLKSMLESGHKPDIQIISDKLSDFEARQLEIRLIAQYGRRDLKLGPLLNLTDGGDGTYRSPMSLETRLKLSKQMSERMLGNKYTLGLIRKTRRPIVGKLFGIIVHRYDFIYAAKADGYDPSNIIKCLKGRKAIAYGLIWEYL